MFIKEIVMQDQEIFSSLLTDCITNPNASECEINIASETTITSSHKTTIEKTPIGRNENDEPGASEVIYDVTEEVETKIMTNKKPTVKKAAPPKNPDENTEMWEIAEDGESIISTNSKTTIGKSKSAPKKKSAENEDESTDEIIVISDSDEKKVRFSKKATATKAKPAPRSL